MRFEGVLIAWNHEAGYGAIRPRDGGEDVFVGLAAFPMDGEGPRPDEALSFEIVSARDGRKTAVNLKRLSRVQPTAAMREVSGAAAARVRARQAQRKRRLFAAAALCTMVVALGSAHWWPPASSAGAGAVMKR